MSMICTREIVDPVCLGQTEGARDASSLFGWAELLDHRLVLRFRSNVLAHICNVRTIGKTLQRYQRGSSLIMMTIANLF